MRLPTEKELVVIGLLLDGEETYAWDLVRKSEGGLAQNGIYVILMRMVARGLLADRVEERVSNRAGPRRRLYKLTAEGMAAREAYLAAVEKYPQGHLARTAIIFSTGIFSTILSASPAATNEDNWVTVWTIANRDSAPIFYGSSGKFDIIDVTYPSETLPQNAGRFTAFTPDSLTGGQQPYTAAEGTLVSDGQWYDIAESVANTSSSIWVVIAILMMVALALLWRDALALLRWGFRYACSTLAEEMYIASEMGHSAFLGGLLGVLRGIGTGIVGASPFGGASVHRFKKK